MPCNDVKAQSKVDNHKKVTVNMEDSHSDNSDDACSPFCFCSCCQITVTAFKIEPLLQVPSPVSFYFTQKILFQKKNIAYQVYDHIWQPPKI
jgi:hypothetical protein